MTEIQAMTLSLLLFIAYRLVNPANERDMEALGKYRDFLDSLVAKQGEAVE
jgi:hypothetical protein